MARIVYHLLKTGKSFDETVFTEQEELHTKRLEKKMHKQAIFLDFQLVPVQTIQ
jgi:hypothetical protein